MPLKSRRNNAGEDLYDDYTEHSYIIVIKLLLINVINKWIHQLGYKICAN